MVDWIVRLLHASTISITSACPQMYIFCFPRKLAASMPASLAVFVTSLLRYPHKLSIQALLLLARSRVNPTRPHQFSVPSRLSNLLRRSVDQLSRTLGLEFATGQNSEQKEGGAADCYKYCSNLALLQHQNFVGIPDGRQPVRDREGRPA